ncbi:hypothetical protein WA158_008244 [Blastocystis sp. Blastoise]
MNKRTDTVPLLKNAYLTQPPLKDDLYAIKYKIKFNDGNLMEINDSLLKKYQDCTLYDICVNGKNKVVEDDSIVVDTPKLELEYVFSYLESSTKEFKDVDFLRIPVICKTFKIYFDVGKETLFILLRDLLFSFDSFCKEKGYKLYDVKDKKKNIYQTLRSVPSKRSFSDLDIHKQYILIVSDHNSFTSLFPSFSLPWGSSSSSSTTSTSLIDTILPPNLPLIFDNLRSYTVANGDNYSESEVYIKYQQLLNYKFTITSMKFNVEYKDIKFVHFLLSTTNNNYLTYISFPPRYIAADESLITLLESKQYNYLSTLDIDCYYIPLDRTLSLLSSPLFSRVVHINLYLTYDNHGISSSSQYLLTKITIQSFQQLRTISIFNKSSLSDQDTNHNILFKWLVGIPVNNIDTLTFAYIDMTYIRLLEFLQNLKIKINIKHLLINDISLLLSLYNYISSENLLSIESISISCLLTTPLSMNNLKCLLCSDATENTQQITFSNIYIYNISENTVKVIHSISMKHFKHLKKFIVCADD